MNYHLLKDILFKGQYLKTKNNYKVIMKGFNGDTKLFDVIKTFCFNYYYIICIMKDRNLIKDIREEDIIKIYLSYGNLTLYKFLENKIQEEI